MNQERVSYRQLFALWLPLALSWTMMSIAGPVANAGISRLPEPAVNLAAQGLTMSIAVLVESPIIMILSTSVSLVRSRTSYLLLRRFVTHLSIILTVIGFLVYFTPLYDVLFLRVMGVPPEVAQAAHPALRVLLLWPAAIGWRRLYQGVLIQHGQSKLVSYGTVFRLASLVATVVIGVSVGLSPGALVGGLGMAISVIVEMLVIRWWTLPLIRREVLPVAEDPPDVEPMDYRRLVRFYLPLAGTDAMRVLSRPVTTAGIARAANSTLSLAAWPVGSGLSMLFSSSIMALQEVVLAQIDNEGNQRRVANFASIVGLTFSSLLAVVILTPVADWYFGDLLGVPTDVKALALSSVLFLVPMPLLFAGRNLQRGILISRRQSGLVQLGMSVNLLALVAILVIGAASGRVQGVMLGIWATVGAEILEVLVLWWLRQWQAPSRAQAKAASSVSKESLT